MNLIHRNNAYFCFCLFITTLDTLGHNRKSEKLKCCQINKEMLMCPKVTIVVRFYAIIFR